MPTANDRRKLASRTRGLEASTASQIRADGYRSLDKLAEGEVHCPVCRDPALRYDDHGEVSSLYLHAGRAFPCRSTERVLTTQEILDAIPPVRWGL